MHQQQRTEKNFISRRNFLSSLVGASAAAGLVPLVDQAKSEDKSSSNNPKMKIFIFSKHLQWLEYPEMAQTAKRLGFDGLDLTVRPGGHVLPERVKDDLPRAVEAMKKSGLEISMMTTDIRDPSEKYTRDILETASQLGFRYYRMGPMYYKKNKSIPEQLAELKPKFRELAAINKKYNIQGAYQNHAGSRNVGAAVWDIWELFKELDAQWMGFQFDIRHATVEGGTAWPINFRLLTPYIATIIAKDFLWLKTEKGWKCQNCPLGVGMVDFLTYFKMVKEAGVSGPLSLHFEYDLGGANKGARTLSIPADKVLEAMQRDLAVLKNWLVDAGL